LAVEMDVYFNLSQDSWLPATDYPRASRSFLRIAGSGNEIGHPLDPTGGENTLSVRLLVG
jgi:hypothetical protein